MIYQNILFSTADTTFEDLPGDIADLLSQDEKVVLQSGLIVLIDKLASINENKFALFLKTEISLDDPMKVYLERIDNLRWHCWFGFFYENSVIRFQVGVEKFPMMEFLPKRLRTLYQMVGGISLEGMGEFGLIPANRLEMTPIEADDRGRKDYVPFFSWGNGDYVGCSRDGKAISLSHEEGPAVTDLDDFLDNLTTGCFFD